MPTKPIKMPGEDAPPSGKALLKSKTLIFNAAAAAVAAAPEVLGFIVEHAPVVADVVGVAGIPVSPWFYPALTGITIVCNFLLRFVTKEPLRKYDIQAVLQALTPRKAS